MAFAILNEVSWHIKVIYSISYFAFSSLSHNLQHETAAHSLYGRLCVMKASTQNWLGIDHSGQSFSGIMMQNIELLNLCTVY